jgi:hypothetical protein
MVRHWILRIGDAINFINSSKYKLWCIKSRNKQFINNVKPNDILWFIKNGGQIIAMATYKYHNKREFGELINISLTDEELGFKNKNYDNWDIEVYYSNLYNLSNIEMYSYYQIRNTICEYYKYNISFDLEMEYKNIIKYSKIASSFI